ncbi:hypothetical protein [Methanobrevibacter sp.]|uniref:hypothetical protein n=1 Tax=Methanobrevibacter sp. TaxID=66852 RepID=UPI0038901739
MLNKKLMILTIILVSVLAVSAVSAVDNDTSDVVSVEENQVILSENNDDGTFDDLQSEINNATQGSVLNLTRK